jgi:transposase InsO family protein
MTSTARMCISRRTPRSPRSGWCECLNGCAKKEACQRCCVPTTALNSKARPSSVGPRRRAWSFNTSSGKPNQNAYIERFNRTLSEDLLDTNLFMRLDDVRRAVYWWQVEYNEQRPHDALGGIPPVTYRIRNAGDSTYELSA